MNHNWQDRFIALEEDHLALKAKYAALEKRNAELEQIIADLKNNKAKQDAESFRKFAEDSYVKPRYLPPE